MMTYFNLDSLSQPQLLQIAKEYYGLNPPNNVTKKQLVLQLEARMGVADVTPSHETTPYTDPGTPKYSARVQRLMDLKERGEQLP